MGFLFDFYTHDYFVNLAKKIKVHYRFNQLLLENLVFNSVVFVCCPFYDKSIRSDEESEIK